MFGKNKNKKVGLCVMVVTSCFILAGLWAVLATPETALADHKPGHDKPGGGGGGGGGGVPTCVQFYNGGNVMGDKVGDEDNAPYYHNKKENITVEFSKFRNNSRLTLNTNSTDKAANGRKIFIDFGIDPELGIGVTLAPGTPNEMTIQTTDDALAYERVLGVSAKLKVGAHQEFDFLNMVENEPNSNVNLRILVTFYFTDGSRDSLFIRLDPNPIGAIDPGRRCPSSDSVTVTYDGNVGGLRRWRVETQTVDQGACLSRSGDCDGCLLLDVDPDGPDFGLDPGHIALSFGFTVTAAP